MPNENEKKDAIQSKSDVKKAKSDAELAKECVQRIRLYETLIIEVKSISNFRYTLYRFAASVNVIVETKAIGPKTIEVYCKQSNSNKTFNLEVKIFDAPLQDYAKAKRVIDALLFVGMFCWIEVKDFDEFSKFMDLLKNKGTFYTYNRDALSKLWRIKRVQ